MKRRVSSRGSTASSPTVKRGKDLSCWATSNAKGSGSATGATDAPSGRSANRSRSWQRYLETSLSPAGLTASCSSSHRSRSAMSSSRSKSDRTRSDNETGTRPHGVTNGRASASKSRSSRRPVSRGPQRRSRLVGQAFNRSVTAWSRPRRRTLVGHVVASGSRGRKDARSDVTEGSANGCETPSGVTRGRAKGWSKANNRPGNSRVKTG